MLPRKTTQKWTAQMDIWILASDSSDFPEPVRTPTQHRNQFKTELYNGGLKVRERSAKINYSLFPLLATK